MTHRLTIDRWRITCIVPRDHPAPEQVRRRLDGVAHAHLPEQVRRLTGPLLEANDESIWFIRRLDLDLAVNVAAEEDALARHWAQALGQVLRRRLRDGQDGEAIICFSDRTAYLARFLIDLARQQARRCWYYAEFQSLFVLGDGTAACAALARSPALAEAVLLRLSEESELEPVLGLLSAREASKVYDLLLPSHEGDADPLPAILAAWPGAALHWSRAGWVTPHNSLRLFLATREAGVPPSAGLRMAIATLLELADWLGAEPSFWTTLTAERLVKSAGDVPCVKQLLLLTTGQPGVLADVLATIQPVPTGAFGTTQPVATSPFAGLFLAWSAFVQAGLAKLCDDDAPLRFLIALKLLGRSAGSQTFFDVAPLLAAGLQHPPAPAEWRSWTMSLDRRRELLRSMCRMLRGRCWLDGRCLKVERVQMPDARGEVLLFRDTLTDAWVYADFLHEPVSEILDTVIALIEEKAGASEVALLPAADSGSLFEHVDNPRVRILAGRRLLPETLQNAVAIHEERARPAARDFEYFTLAAGPTDPHADLTATLLARAALRAFAARFRGFGWSSADYIGRNFLAAAGTIRAGAEPIDVHLRPPPLHLVLRMAGLDRESFVLPNGVPVNVNMDHDR